jgi:hypothetical protein
MKIAFGGFSGSVGKTTAVSNLMVPRMPNAKVFAVETINETAAGVGVEVEKIRGENFRSLFKALITLDDAIIDVGASNVEDFLAGLMSFDGAIDEIDIFVVPVTPGTKEQKETLSFVAALAQIGVSPDKIRIMFNRVSNDVRDEFPFIFNFAKKENNCVVDDRVVIFENELFDLLSARKLTISAALSDPTDYKGALRSLGPDGDPKLRARFADMCAIVALSKTVNRNLDRVFDALTA